MKILYANGDSWTYGQEIPSQHPESLCHTSQYYGSWPYHLATLRNSVCVNEAGAAGSNDRIFRKTVEYINEYSATGRNPQDLTIVLGWTTEERTEIETNGTYTRITVNSTVGKYRDPIHGRQVEEYRDCYYRIIDLRMAAVKQVRAMLTLRTLTRALGISYWDFQALGPQPSQVIQLASEHYHQELPHLYYNTWNNYCQLHDQPRYPHGHPTPAAHQHWANLLNEWMTQ